ncbi:serine protease [bacterium]|nr:serine protease [bacterium]MDB4296197.1 serine protease [bacterium]MDB4452170.1 serine protease [Akkermansiaceae bacterium]
MKRIFLLLALTAKLAAQAPGVPIFDQSKEGLKAEDQNIGAKAEKFLEEKKALSHEEVVAEIKNPEPVEITLAKPLERFLTAAEIAEKTALSTYRIGWAYLCKNCDHWHTNLGGGYAISADGLIATCAHVIDHKGIDMRKGALIAVDQAGKVYPVTKVHRYHRKMDAAIIRIDAKTTPLALTDQVRPGDPAFCLSRPLKQGKYFSKGIVNRFFWDGGSRENEDDRSVATLAYLKMNVSSRWAPGSSGSPVLDQCGNVIGHVALINNLGKGKEKPSLITVHAAIPARSVQALCGLGRKVKKAEKAPKEKKAPEENKAPEEEKAPEEKKTPEEEKPEEATD